MYQIDTKKYPWLVSKYESWDSEGKPEIEEYEVIDGLPEGWLVSFGDLMFEDLDKVIKRDHLTEFRIDEAKEKFGGMRLYTSGGNKETDEIIDKYSHLSENICMICGKPDVYMTNTGWIYPCCEKCWNEDRVSKNNKYKDVISEKDSGKMADIRRITRFSKEGNETLEFDLRPTAQRIRDYWNKRFGDDRK